MRLHPFTAPRRTPRAVPKHLSRRVRRAQVTRAMDLVVKPDRSPDVVFVFLRYLFFSRGLLNGGAQSTTRTAFATGSRGVSRISCAAPRESQLPFGFSGSNTEEMISLRARLIGILLREGPAAIRRPGNLLLFSVCCVGRLSSRAGISRPARAERAIKAGKLARPCSPERRRLMSVRR